MGSPPVTGGAANRATVTVPVDPPAVAVTCGALPAPPAVAVAVPPVLLTALLWLPASGRKLPLTVPLRLVTAVPSMLVASAPLIFAVTVARSPAFLLVS